MRVVPRTAICARRSARAVGRIARATPATWRHHPRWPGPRTKPNGFHAAINVLPATAQRSHRPRPAARHLATPLRLRCVRNRDRRAFRRGISRNVREQLSPGKRGVERALRRRLQIIGAATMLSTMSLRADPEILPPPPFMPHSGQIRLFRSPLTCRLPSSRGRCVVRRD